MLFGDGMAFAHEASSAIHAASSSKIGAPCAAKITGIRPVADFLGYPIGSSWLSSSVATSTEESQSGQAQDHEGQGRGRARRCNRAEPRALNLEVIH